MSSVNESKMVHRDLKMIEHLRTLHCFLLASLKFLAVCSNLQLEISHSALRRPTYKTGSRDKNDCVIEFQAEIMIQDKIINTA